ncbi:uncharacterized protein LOC126992656 isoform X3 [Eriocheir sinensis]|uniref:uncharacterized protein LOC126992656 isoform X2 n=1 Tax=Eriocheir sinensis TaxID=95602 RepID=UPI0021C83B67|nr:uncharacterized protein LOC126992656 isoform X2 [Eriocheir sinensis]XP_050707422.1 uncharacterized protein LOC126992656 isoform X3 [Eriocheir sinensis]
MNANVQSRYEVMWPLSECFVQEHLKVSEAGGSPWSPALLQALPRSGGAPGQPKVEVPGGQPCRVRRSMGTRDCRNTPDVLHPMAGSLG